MKKNNSPSGAILEIITAGNVPLPPKRSNKGRPALYGLESMAIGECNIVRGRTAGAVAAAVWRYQQKSEVKFVIRGGGKGKNHIVKIWRIK